MFAYCVLISCSLYYFLIERFSSDLDMKTREQNRNNKRTEIERFDWFIERIQTRLAFEKNFMPENFLEINRYFALTSYCHTIDQSNDAFSILGFSLAGKRRGPVLIFFIHWLIKQIRNTYQTIFQGHTKIALTN